MTKVESMAFLRARFPEGGEVEAQVDRKPFTTPWLCLLAASDPAILPPALGFALSKGGSSGGRGAVLALIGPEYAMGKAFLALQGAKDFTLQVHVADQPRFLFNTPIKSVVRLDRDDLNRWLMDQTGSVSYVPYIGAILIMPYEWDVLTKFDQVATGFVPDEMLGGNEEAGHIQMAEYAPELVYVAKIDRPRLVSGWDIPGSLARVEAVNTRLHHGAVETAPAPKKIYTGQPEHTHDAGEVGEDDDKFGPTNFVVDSTTEVLLDRMQNIARLIGIVSLLVALPLLWMAWVLAANLAGLLMLNERRKLGLMRLRGISGQLMGRALLVSVTAGGVGGGMLGLIAGSVLPLVIYEGGRLPLSVLMDARQLAIFGAFLLISVVLALVVSRRLVRYATTISPLEASVRVSGSEAVNASMRFGFLQVISIVLGGYVLAGWIFDFALSELPAMGWFRTADRLLDFLGLPLFLYGVATLLASKRERIQRVMAPVLRPIGGVLGRFALRHMSAKPHRTVAFLLIVALMSSVSLYPIVTSRSFEDKAVRGAKVQIGTDWQVLYNAPDLIDVDRLNGPAATKFAALKPEIDKLVASLRGVAGVRDATYMVESVLPTFYLPGYGLRGVPLFLLGNPEAYRSNVYSEPSVGLSGAFSDIMAQTSNGGIAVSPPVADFWRLDPGRPSSSASTPSGARSRRHRRHPRLPAGYSTQERERPPGLRAGADRLSELPVQHQRVPGDGHRQPAAQAAADPAAPRDRAAQGGRLRRPGGVPEGAGEGGVLSAAGDSQPDPGDRQGGQRHVHLARAGEHADLPDWRLDPRARRHPGDCDGQLQRRSPHAGAAPHPRRVAARHVAVRDGDAPVAGARRVGAGRRIGRAGGLRAGELRLEAARDPHRRAAPADPPRRAALTAWIGLLLIVLLVGVASGFSWWVYRHTAHKSMQSA